MKRFVILAAAIAGMVQICSAAPACAAGTLSSYVSLGSAGCIVGTDTLFNFQVLPGTAGATAISPLSVLLSPLSGPSIVGLTSIANVTSSAGSVQESLFTYQLTGGSYVGSTIILSNSS
ncbi:MAG TPA: hypothetical protein VK604_15490, partial [Bryobacteraceae bacterium]|nr:hypothetical protein [Bryobacteraceae bacterium]